MALRPVDPITLKLNGGEEREFLLTLGAIRRLKKRFNISAMNDLLARDMEECGVPVLYEALTDKRGETEDQFADKLPASIEWVAKAIAMLFGASFPEEDTAARPPEASPTPQDGTGSESVPSGASDSGAS